MYKLAISPRCLLLSIYLHGYMWCEYGMWIFVCQSVERENSQGKLEVNQFDVLRHCFYHEQSRFCHSRYSWWNVVPCCHHLFPQCVKKIINQLFYCSPLPPPLSLTRLKVTVGKILRLKGMYASGSVLQLVFYTLHWCNAVICKSMF